MKLLQIALEKQNYTLAAHVLVYGLIKARVDPSRDSFPISVMARRANHSGRNNPQGFYSRALGEAERLEFEQALQIEGIDEEIALLRVKLKELVEKQPDRIDMHFEAANIIARLVKTRYQMTKEQKKSLKEATAKVLTELAVPLGIGVGIKVAGK